MSLTKSSHASTSIRSPILGAQLHPNASATTIGAGGAGSSSTSPSSPKRPGGGGGVHLPPQPTIPPPMISKTPSPILHSVNSSTGGGSTTSTRNSFQTPASTYTASTRATTTTNASNIHATSPPPSVPNTATTTTTTSPPSQLEKSTAFHQRYDSGGNSVSSNSNSGTGASLLPDDWQQDSSVTACHHCQIKFSLLTRKHHCRSCGLIHCDNCSKYRSTIPSKNYHEKVRVCGKCYYMLKKIRRGNRSVEHSPSRSTSGRDHGASSKAVAPIQIDPSRANSARSATTMLSPASSSSSTAAADELQRELTALHALHSSYQPEHHYLTSLLSNAAQLEQTYISTIQFLYNYLQQQQATHLTEWRQQQACIQSQQKQIEHLEEILRTGGATGTYAKNSRGVSPVPTTTTNNTRSQSPSLLNLNSGNPSRASPSLHGFNPPTLANPYPTKPLAASSPMLQSSNNMHQFPPLPFGLSSSNPLATVSQPASQTNRGTGVIYDAASEEAYLEMDGVVSDSSSTATMPPAPYPSHISLSDGTLGASPILTSSMIHMATLPSASAKPSLAPSSRHANYLPSATNTTTTGATNNSVLTVTEPPSPPAPSRLKRAASNPTAAAAAITPPIERTGRRGHKKVMESPSVQKLLDEVGM